MASLHLAILIRADGPCDDRKRAQGLAEMAVFELAAGALFTSALARLAGPGWRITAISFRFSRARTPGETLAAIIGITVATAPERDADGFQCIGDVGRLDAEGYLYLGGWRAGVIDTGGVKVHPEAIEAVLLRAPGVGDAGVFGTEDREWRQRVIACLVPQEGAALDEAVLRAFCLERLRPQEVTKTFRLFETLPCDNFGKIRRKALRAEFTEPGEAGWGERGEPCVILVVSLSAGEG